MQLKVSEAEDDDEFELIDSSSDHEEGNVDNAQVGTRFNLPVLFFLVDDSL